MARKPFDLKLLTLTLTHITPSPHLYQDTGMVPPYEEDRRDGSDYKIRSKAGGEVTPRPNPTYT